MWNTESTRRERTDKELELYRRERLLRIEEEISEAKARVTDAHVGYLKDVAGYEHTYWQKRAVLDKDIAEKEARVAALRNAEAGFIEKLEAKEWIVSSLNEEAKRLYIVIKDLTNKIPDRPGEATVTIAK